MTKTTGQERRRAEPTHPSGAFPEVLRRGWPLALATLLLVVLAIPAALVVAPGFRSPERPAPAAAPPAWQQVPATLSVPQVLATLEPSAQVPVASAVAAQVDPVLQADGGGAFTGTVQDALTGQVLFDRGGAENRVPASNLKLLTAVAALRTLGPDHRFTTQVVPGPVPGQVVLVGGGDVLLAAGASRPGETMGHAGLATLAARTVESLKAAGTAGSIKVLLDDSLFSGPALNPAWQAGDVEAGEVAPLHPLALNSARFDPAVTTGPRPQDAAMAAAEEFAAQLRTAGAGAGITVAPGVERLPAAAKPAAPGTGAIAGTGAADGGPARSLPPAVLAQVESATVAEQVDLMLQVSDNYLAETMGRMAAAASGRPGSSEGAIAAVGDQLAAAGIAMDSVKLVDVCGLAMENRVSARQLTEVVRAITTWSWTRTHPSSPTICPRATLRCCISAKARPKPN